METEIVKVANNIEIDLAKETDIVKKLYNILYKNEVEISCVARNVIFNGLYDFIDYLLKYFKLLNFDNLVIQVKYENFYISLIDSRTTILFSLNKYDDVGNFYLIYNLLNYILKKYVINYENTKLVEISSDYLEVYEKYFNYSTIDELIASLHKD